jgi:aminoglycoside phosphotransferase (APT) family kinase protein
MIENYIISRAENIKTFIQRNELKTIKSIDISEIPEEILRYTGRDISISYPQQGMCSLLGIFKSQERNYVLKIAKGDYRGRELCSEYLAMKSIYNTCIPVPEVHMFLQKGDFYYLLRECSAGVPLNTLFNECTDKAERMFMIDEMAQNLCKIHHIKIDGHTWEEFIEAQLYFAEQHMKNNTIDPSEFIFDGKEVAPEELLQWLKDNKPEPAEVCLIHGDYRPKNFLWNNKHISSIFDWSFCDFGDPCYDFAIFMYYLRDEEEKQRFLNCYGVDKLDGARLKYFERMAPFINI